MEVSVDTNFRRKNLTRYSVIDREGVRLYLSPALWRWGKRVHVDVRQGWFGKGFEIDVEHRHTGSCSH